MLKYFSPAKINPVLEVLGKRPDDYHELKSIVQAIDLCDILYFEPADEIFFECTAPALNTPDNLVVRVARLLKEHSSYGGGAKIRLEKRVPWGAGLGGGSSNAAITLLALNNLWDLELSAPDLLSLAAKLGSDVPFFIHGGTALVEGRGEKVTPLPPLKPLWLALVVPPFTGMPEKTARLYSLLEPQHYTKGEFISRALESLQKKGEIAPSLMFNAFDIVALKAFPGLELYWNALQEVGAESVHLAGSGPVLFTVVEDQRRAEDMATALNKRGLKAFAAQTKSAPQRN